MAGNNNLGSAKAEKNDEFYTRLIDIENELRYYRRHFKGKTVLCNCDDPFESQFFKYFVMNFVKLGLKKLIATCYRGSPIAGTQLDFWNSSNVQSKGIPYKAIVTSVYDATGDGYLDMEDIKELFRIGKNELVELKEDGDFRSDECLALLDEADIVCTNPPFSLFHEYVMTLVKHNKKFIIIAPLNGIKYKHTFPLIKNGTMWLGVTSPKEFIASKNYTKRANLRVKKDGTTVAVFGNIYWVTNLDIKKRHEDLILVKRYDASSYPSYDNFDGIEVSDVKDIPYDYDGFMGVPISFLEVHNPEQFELIGRGEGNLAKEIGVTKNFRGRTDLAITLSDGTHTCPYARIVIRNKHPEPRKQS